LIDSNRATVIFTDLDGSLIDHFSYSSEVAAPVVEKLLKKGIPLIFCSSKTRAEQEVYRRLLEVKDPFIAENGGAIFIPEGYFSFNYEYKRSVDGYRVIELALPYGDVRRRIEDIREKCGIEMLGYGDMSDQEVAKITGLNLTEARLAKKREYQETLNLTGSESDINKALREIKEAGLSYSRGGRFYGVMHGSDKGRAVEILSNLFRKKLGNIRTLGIGDNYNDVPMLAKVDQPVLVQKPDGVWADIDLPNIYKAEGIGPQGWVKAVAGLLGL
jgi:mannosyl-3-phosphoglycerate phosphatase